MQEHAITCRAFTSMQDHAQAGEKMHMSMHAITCKNMRLHALTCNRACMRYHARACVRKYASQHVALRTSDSACRSMPEHARACVQVSMQQACDPACKEHAITHARNMQSACKQHASSMLGACDQHAKRMQPASNQHVSSMHPACNQHAGGMRHSMQRACDMECNMSCGGMRLT